MARSAAARQAAVERTRRWRAANPERARTLNRRVGKAWGKRNPDKVLAKDRRWKNANREQARATVRRGRRDKRAFLAEVVGAACVDCGDERAGAVEYHHPNGKPRGQVPLTHLSWEKLGDEAMKLIALCGACHGVRHHRERNHASS